MSDVRWVDIKFAELLSRWCKPEDKSWLVPMVQQLSLQASLGHSCTRLDTLGISAADLAGMDIVEIAGVEIAGAEGTGIRSAPLVLSDERLYLRKLYEAEKMCEQRFLELASQQCQYDIDAIDAKLAPLPFMGNEQRKAIAKSLATHLAVITGGPGTGKTTLVVRLLAVLIDQFPVMPEIAIVAPTGKASARLKNSIEVQKNSWLADLRGFDYGVIERISSDTSTLQRLLGIHPFTGRSKFNALNPLRHDVIVVDEASMIDLVLMKQLLCALKPDALLILLGDPYQLASVEAGSVLYRLVEQGMNASSPLYHCTSTLHESHRFNKAPAIGKMAAAVNGGDVLLAKETALSPVDTEVKWLDTASAMQQAVDGYKLYRDAIVAYPVEKDVHKVFAAFDAWKVFSPFKSGQNGVYHLNQHIQQQLGFPVDAAWYTGKAVMVNENDHALGLFNGDIGIMLDEQCRHVLFPEADGGYRSVAIGRLPAHETVFAMTVHKSQGSEFDACLLIVPSVQDRQQRLLSREILYTAITRAKQCFYLSCGEEELEIMVETKTQRESGLFFGCAI